MPSDKRVVITGLSVVCGLGTNLSDVWEALINGKSGVSLVEQIPTDILSVKIGGEIKNFNLSEDILSLREQDRYDRFLHLALAAGHEAINSANASDFYKDTRMGCILGVGMGGFPLMERNYNTILEKGPRRVSPFFIPGVIPNMASGLISINHGLKGTNYTVASACASSGHAIQLAYNEIQLGRHDYIVTGGAESTLSHLPYSGFQSMKALSKRNDEPQKASRPFDKDRDGFIMGEGAGILVIEEYEKAKERGAKIYAEIVGHGANSDAFHITAPHSEGLGAAQCIQQALDFASLAPEDIDYINAHGTSTPLGDLAETLAIKKTFGEHSKNLLVSSTKSMTGHCLGAAGGVESAFSVMALHTGIIPPTINLDNPSPECDLNYVPHKAVKKDIRYALNNSFGFGGTNSSLIFKKVD